MVALVHLCFYIRVRKRILLPQWIFSILVEFFQPSRQPNILPTPTFGSFGTPNQSFLASGLSPVSGFNMRQAFASNSYEHHLGSSPYLQPGIPIHHSNHPQISGSYSSSFGSFTQTASSFGSNNINFGVSPIPMGNMPSSYGIPYQASPSTGSYLGMSPQVVGSSILGSTPSATGTPNGSYSNSYGRRKSAKGNNTPGTGSFKNSVEPNLQINNGPKPKHQHKSGKPRKSGTHSHNSSFENNDTGTIHDWDPFFTTDDETASSTGNPYFAGGVSSNSNFKKGSFDYTNDSLDETLYSESPPNSSGNFDNKPMGHHRKTGGSFEENAYPRSNKSMGSSSSTSGQYGYQTNKSNNNNGSKGYKKKQIK